MKPNYIAKKSAWSVVSIRCILFFWLIVPIIVQVVRIVKAKCYSIEFYDNKIICKSGVLSTNERQSVFAGVYSVSISQTLIARIFKYGNISVDCPGRWDVDTVGIKNPDSLKRYLESYISSNGMTNIIYN